MEVVMKKRIMAAVLAGVMALSPALLLLLRRRQRKQLPLKARKQKLPLKARHRQKLPQRPASRHTSMF